MNNTTTSQSAPNPFAAFTAFDPMAFWSQTQQTFQKAFADACGRSQSYADQLASMEAQFIARAQGAVTSWAQMTQDAISYTAQLSAEARKLGLETMRKMNVSV